MTIVYPIESQKDYTELKYSLRSIDKFIQKPYEVVVIGGKLPEWITNVTWVNLPDIPDKKLLSVRRKILASLAYCDEILFMNDDFYLTKQATSFPYYFNGDLKKCNNSGSKQVQTQLNILGKPTKSFDIHYPIIFRKDFIDIMENFADDCLIRSAYCNYLEIEGVQIQDCKFIKAMKPNDVHEVVKSSSLISTGNYSLKSVLPILKEMFPYKSIFEA